jgi:hypothetical protein
MAAAPKLDLGWKLPAEDDRSLGLKDVGEWPELSEEEKWKLDAIRLQIDEVKLAWASFGKQLRETGGTLSVRYRVPDRLC